MLKRLLNTFYWVLYKHYKKDHVETDFIARYYSASVIGMTLNFWFISILHCSVFYIDIFSHKYLYVGIFLCSWMLFTYFIYKNYRKYELSSYSQIKMSHYLVFSFFFASMLIMVFSIMVSANLVIYLK